MKKRMISFLLVLCMVMALLPVSAFALTGKGTLDDPWVEGTVKAYLDGHTLHVFGSGSLPDYTNGAQPWYGRAGRIDTVVIENSVDGLGNNAFSCCGSLQSITLKRNVLNTPPLQLGVNSIPVGVEVNLVLSGTDFMAEYNSNQPWANLKTKLSSVTLEEGVRSVGKQAFSGCTRLKSVSIPSTVEIVGQEAFADCVSLTEVTLKHDFASDLSIGSAAFPVANNGFRINLEICGSAAIPNYANKNQQPWADIRNSIRNLTIGGDVAGVGDNAFAGCMNLKNVSLYFNEHSLKAQKIFGKNWLRENSEIPVSVSAVSGTRAFKTWGGATFADKSNASTLLFYNRNGGTVTAEWAPVALGITVEPKEDKVFPEMEVGYPKVTPYTVTVKNSGNSPTGELVVEMSGGQTTAFELSAHSLKSLGRGESVQVSVAPKQGLSLGSYSSSVAISNESGVVASFNVSFIASTDRSRAERFVSRLYTVALGRPADPQGLKNWTDILVEKKMTAAEVAAGFISSEEFRLKDLSDEEFVRTLYRTLMNREADAEGLKNWVNALKSGKSRCWFFKQFCDSPEFHAICAAHTLVPGTIEVNQFNMDAISPKVNDAQAKAFVERLYKTVLGRSADAQGLDNWTKALVTRSQSGSQVAAGFFASAEYLGRNRSNSQFVEDLYATLLNRTPDPGGLQNWTRPLTVGQSRCWVFKRICESAEFRNICRSYGIAVGTVGENQYNMGGSAVSDGKGGISMVKADPAKADAFVKHLYSTILNRTADEGGLKNWTAQMCDKGVGGTAVAASLMASPEFTGRKLGNEDFVRVCYKALMGRDADPEGLQSWTAKLAAGTKRADVLAGIAGSSECINFCLGMGINAGSFNPASVNLG